MAKKIKAEIYKESFDEENEIEDEVELEPAYDIDFEDYEDDEEEVEIKPRKTKAKKKNNKKTTQNNTKASNGVLIKIINILFVLAIIAIVIISVDIICVAKYNVGPYFAINTGTLQDGGTKVYYGLGYKVIKYNELRGRQDTQIGFWNLPYNTTPTKIQDIDLAIEFQNKPQETGKKYYKQYLEITSTIKSIDKEKNKLTLQYTDPDGKYTLQIECPLAIPQELINLTEQQEVTIKGTVYKFALKDDKQPNTVYFKDCFVE